MIRNRGRGSEGTDRSNEWMTTYSDMVTLLLAFFVLLFSFSTIDTVEFERVIMSLQEALGLLQGGRTVTSAEPLMDVGDSRHREQIEAIQRRQLLEAKIRLQRKLTESGVDEGVSFEMTERGLIMHFTDQVLFESGRAQLRPEALTMLDLLSPTLEDLPNQIRVEGHTDDVPISTLQFPSNWELSTVRATSVLRYLLEIGEFSPQKMSAAGYGEHRPRATNETDEGRAMNRRVDVVLLRLDAHGTEPAAESGDTGSADVVSGGEEN